MQEVHSLTLCVPVLPVMNIDGCDINGIKTGSLHSVKKKPFNGQNLT